MTPGLAGGPPFPIKATKGAVVAIAGLDHPSVPKAIGECEIDVSALNSVVGAKGHAIKCLHWYGDEIWDWNQHNRPGLPPPDEISGWLGVQSDDTGTDDLQTRVSNLDLGDEDEVEEEEEGGGVLITNEPISSLEDAFESAPRREWTTTGRCLHILNNPLLTLSRDRFSLQKRFFVLRLASS